MFTDNIPKLISDTPSVQPKDKGFSAPWQFEKLQKHPAHAQASPSAGPKEFALDTFDDWINLLRPHPTAYYKKTTGQTPLCRFFSPRKNILKKCLKNPPKELKVTAPEFAYKAKMLSPGIK